MSLEVTHFLSLFFHENAALRSPVPTHFLSTFLYREQVWRSRCYKGLLWLRSLRQALRWCLVVSFLVLLCRPFALRFAAKLIGGVLRLVVRRLLSLLALVLDQVFEELILQLAVVVQWWSLPRLSSQMASVRRTPRWVCCTSWSCLRAAPWQAL